MKYFMWYDSGRGPCYGPHGYGDVNAIGKSVYHDLDTLLKMPTLSDSLRKRLVGARVGTSIKVHYLHSSGDLMLKCIGPDEVNLLNALMGLHKEIIPLRKQLTEKENSCEQIWKKLGFNSD